MYRATRTLTAASLGLSLVALAACGNDRSVNPVAEQVEGAAGAINTASTITAEYDLYPGQSVKINPKSTSRTNRLKWTTTNSGVATVNSQGNVSAKVVGNAIVTVSGSGVLESYAIVVEQPTLTLTSFSLQPQASVTLTSGQTQQFSTSQTWSDGVTRTSGVTYTATGGTITSTGLYTAGSLAGAFMVVATCSCTSPAIADTTFVSVQAPAQLTKLTVSPKTVSLSAGASQQFAVTANWSTGATTVPPVTWTASGGTVSGTGAYVAPSTAGTYRVIVAHTGGTVRDTALVTVAVSGETPKPGANWSVVRDFNTGVEGAVAQRTQDGFDDVAGNSIYSNTFSFDGSQAARLTVDSGATGWGRWGGAIDFPTALTQGQELWLQLYVYIPEDFVVATPSSGSLKFIRIRTKTASGSNGGYNDIQLANDLNQTNAFRMIKEVQNTWYRFGAAGSFGKGRWQRLSVHIAFHSVPAALGGGSRIRVWQNGQRLIDEARIQTLSGADHFADSFYLFTYWNDGAPKTQSMWVDDIRLSTTRPTWASDLQ
ncbi:heparin lyase I family protein [Gemmatimonas sp.]